MIRKRVLLEAAWIWLALAAFAVVNGAFRRSVLEWVLERDTARLLSTTTLAGAVGVAALLWIGTRSVAVPWKELLLIGLAWTVATIVLEAGLGRFGAERSWPELFADYDPARGGFFGLVLVAELISPVLVGLLRRAASPHPLGAH